MIFYRSNRVRNFDIFKAIILIALLVILFFGYMLGWFSNTPFFSSDDEASLTVAQADLAPPVVPDMPKMPDLSEMPPEPLTAQQVAAPTLETFQDGAVFPPGEIDLRGNANQNSELEILLNSTLNGTTRVDNHGSWEYTLAIDEQGEYTIIVNSLDDQGKVAASSLPVNFTIALPTPPEINCNNKHVVVKGNWLSKLAKKHWGSAHLYPAIVTATNHKHEIDATFAKIINPDLIKPGWKLCIVDKDKAKQLSEQYKKLAK